MLPYFLGCPAWNEPAWRAHLYSQSGAGHALQRYARVFNTVEGNTTFYAVPSVETVRRWAQHMPAHFRFTAKLPRSLSHAPSLYGQQALLERFLELLAPLGGRVHPLWLQLPASFAPARLGELVALLDALQGRAVAVEVRHPLFFAGGEEERALNRLLRDRQVERICLDARALFSCTLQSPAVRHAQAKKPRLPVRPTAFSDSPQLRFIGHPALPANDAFLQPWLDKVADWISAGLTPHVYLHTPDNQLAPLLAWRFHRQLQARLPGLSDLPWPAASEQYALL